MNAKLTAKETEVLTLLASGYSMAEVATLLGITRHTIKNHAANMMRKVGVNTTAEVIVAAVRDGAITL